MEEGATLGWLLGALEDISLFVFTGEEVGLELVVDDGTMDGTVVGAGDGTMDGTVVGAGDGTMDGTVVGAGDDASVGLGMILKTSIRFSIEMRAFQNPTNKPPRKSSRRW